MEREATLRSAREVMTPEVFCLEPARGIVEAVGDLLRRGISGAPVTGPDGVLLGVLSEYDCMRVLSAAAFAEEPPGDVAAHMSRDVVTVTPDVDLFTLVERLDQQRLRRVVVVDEARRVVGIVTRRDVVRALIDVTREREHAYGTEKPRLDYSHWFDIPGFSHPLQKR